ncbi:gamma-butyrobetaine dioxygenase-like [Acanthaster planci]|uniref:Gamma-butyrobetaine dioxygenase-like n=1 Tax=Acanthaster planci TaxID=133434 RepID=A0A8B7Y4S4_ACAPL|nr:gamma-butyrobetaine dioxygenase-like [Acanthaster planci]XP_022087328.1 gamma-butyrobetaine dioxygenase-like [Acanthaster planci]XP_022087329.1 gamma-butyrobetaine dioxygenase-like [Acanthaster planci]XP_022087330.1 gamma-butyrobetaine dioxygenase-like [Acanthaster planci]XP_022087331.1 gamma-butyrobetaine dioxygenase-like [Acanthaster planci]
MTESSARDAKADPKVMKRPHLYRFITELNHRKADAGYSIQSASHMLENHSLQVVWRDGESQAYPYMWLRDNCLCKQCYKPSLNSRTFSFTSLDVEMIPIYALPSDDGKSLRLTWPDGHSGEYPSDWLRQYRFENSAPDVTFDSQLQHWDTTLMDSGTLRIFNFEDLMSSDEAVYEWLMEMKLTGICMIRGSSRMEGQVKRLGDRVLFLRSTYYGQTSHVLVKYNATNIAFTGKAFPMHTDLAFLQRPPGAQMIHCIEQAEGPGGENWFTDGFKVALDLKAEDPEAFHLLSNILLEFHDIGEDVFGRFHQHSRHPTISLDRSGSPDHIYLSDHGRMPMMRFPVKQTQKLYQALKKFSNMYHHPNNVFSYKLKEGDIMTFDNRRVIHGRGAFEVTSSSSRHLETGYLEWDEIDSRLRLLQRQFMEGM